MRIGGIVALGLVLEMKCPDCGAVTRLDPSFFAARLGGHAHLSQIRNRLVCTGCGSSRITLRAVAEAPEVELLPTSRRQSTMAKSVIGPSRRVAETIG